MYANVSEETLFEELKSIETSADQYIEICSKRLGKIPRNIWKDSREQISWVIQSDLHKALEELSPADFNLLAEDVLHDFLETTQL